MNSDLGKTIREKLGAPVKAPAGTTKQVTKEEAIAGLTARAQELEATKTKGGMTVTKARDINRRLRTAKAKLRELMSDTQPAPVNQSASSQNDTLRAYLDRKSAALRGRKNS